MKKILLSTCWLLAALILGLSMIVSSCKDDDNDTNSTQKQEQEAQEQASKFWDVVGQLVSVDDVTDDYAGKTFEPTIGLEDESNPLTRVVETNDMQTAASRFASLVQATGINEDTPSYTWADPEIGTMTYTKGGEPENWATVDVNIKAVPHLKQIVYKVGNEGENADPQKCYYRFGDVVSREVEVVFDEKKNDDRRGTITEYWICVRPSFDLEGKGDSHWVCLNTMGPKNYRYWSGSNGTKYYVPYALKNSEKNMQNFAEMLYAICYPEKWYENVNNYHTDGRIYGFSGLPIFEDFKKKYIQYHNQYFWQNVQKGWEKTHVTEKALNIPTLGELVDRIDRDGVHLLYKGYEWWFFSSWDCLLFEANFTNGTDDKEKNLHHIEYKDKEYEKSMKDLKFDVREMGQKFENYAAYFGNDGKYRWAIRHATGKELAKNGKYNPRTQINGVTDVYRYYRDVVPTTDLGDKPEITTDAKDLQYTKRGYYDRGDVVEDEAGNRWACIQCSTFGLKSPNVPDVPYAYFISFNKNAVGSNLEKVVSSKNLAMQIFYNFYWAFHDFAMDYAAGKSDDNPGQNYLRLRNIENCMSVNMFELFATRDSVVRRKNIPESEHNHFLSTIYRDTDKELCVLRGFFDNTIVTQDEGRDFAWRFWTTYPSDKTRRMKLADLADQNLINQYSKDQWVYRPWYDFANRRNVLDYTGPRTATETLTPASRFLYQNNRSVLTGNMPANMYREPIVPFAVKRAKDTGTAAATFEDGTKIKPVKLLKELDASFCRDEPNPSVQAYLAYLAYTNYGLFCNGEFYEFGMNNKP